MVVVGHVNERGAIPVTRGTPLGNPFPMNHPGERDLVCDKYEEWFKARLDAYRYPSHRCVCHYCFLSTDSFSRTGGYYYCFSITNYCGFSENSA